jgi:hypothetical protein
MPGTRLEESSSGLSLDVSKLSPRSRIPADSRIHAPQGVLFKTVAPGLPSPRDRDFLANSRAKLDSMLLRVFAGASLGAVMGGVLGFVVAIVVLAARRGANRARVARGEAPLRNEVMPSLPLPCSVFGALVGVVVAVA